MDLARNRGALRSGYRAGDAMRDLDREQAVANELLQHDVNAEYSHTCLCGEGIWVNGGSTGNQSMARHRAREILRVIDELAAAQRVLDDRAEAS